MQRPQRLAQVVNFSGSTVLTQHDYTYDGVGNRQTHTENIGGTVTPYTYTYNPLNRLLQATGTTTESYTYDPLGNRLSKTSAGATTYYVYDAANQVTKVCVNDPLCLSPATTFSYDLNGNLSSRTDGSLLTYYAYDPENRLAWVGVPGQLAQTYSYDDQGRRVRKTTGALAANYLYDGPDIVGRRGVRQHLGLPHRAVQRTSPLAGSWLSRNPATPLALTTGLMMYNTNVYIGGTPW